MRCFKLAFAFYFGFVELEARLFLQLRPASVLNIAVSKTCRTLIFMGGNLRLDVSMRFDSDGKRAAGRQGRFMLRVCHRCRSFEALGFHLRLGSRSRHRNGFPVGFAVSIPVVREFARTTIAPVATVFSAVSAALSAITETIAALGIATAIAFTAFGAAILAGFAILIRTAILTILLIAGTALTRVIGIARAGIALLLLLAVPLGH